MTNRQQQTLSADVVLLSLVSWMRALKALLLEMDITDQMSTLC